MDNVIWIHAGWVIDGSGRSIQKNVLLKIRNGRIDSMQKYPDSYLELPMGADHQIMDLTNCTVLPGLVDSHVHLFMSGRICSNFRSMQLTADFNAIKDSMDSHIHQYSAHGVLAVRDGGDSSAHALRYKSECLTMADYPMVLKVAGQAWNKPGRYGKLISRIPTSSGSLADAIEQDKSKVDHIKIVNSGLNSLKEYGKETAPQFNADELQQAVRAAQSKQMPVMVHANGKLPVKFAVEAGCHSIEHGFFMGPENLVQMAEKHITWVPTAVTMKAYEEIMNTSGQDAGVVRRNLDHQLEQLYQARRHHVPVAVGTDSGSPGVHHGHAVSEEMQLLMAAGYSIQETVRCATFNGAELLGLKNCGRISAGRAANIIAVQGDPSKLPGSLNKLSTVLIDGIPQSNAREKN